MLDTFTKRGSRRAIAAEAAGLEELAQAALAGGAPVVRLVSVDTAKTSLTTARLSPGAPTAHAAEEFGRRLAHTHAFCPAEGSRVFGQAPAGLDQAPAGLDHAPAGLNQAPAGLDDAPAELDQAPAGLNEALTRLDLTASTPPTSEAIAPAHKPPTPAPPAPHTPQIIAAMGDAPLHLVPAGSPARNWGEFYAQDRLLPYLPDALRNGSISTEGRKTIEHLCEKLRDGTFDSSQPKLVTADAALLHGDLWAGNILWTRNTADLHERVLMRRPETLHASAAITSDRETREWFKSENLSATDGREARDEVVAVLIDPACQGGHAESDLAQLTVFSAPFTERIYSAYHEASPLTDGWRERIGLHQLHILIVHAALFGGSYGAQTLATARKYV